MRARTSTLLVLIALLAGGCTGGGEPEAEPTPILPSSSAPQASPSQSEAAEEEAPEMPAAAREESMAGAEAFIEHWADSLSYALNTGDTREVDRLAAPDCESCQGTSDLITDIYDGGRIESEGWKVKQLGFGTGASNPVAQIDQGRERVWRAGKSKPEVNPAADITLQFFLQRDGDNWLIENYEFV